MGCYNEKEVKNEQKPIPQQNQKRMRNYQGNQIQAVPQQGFINYEYYNALYSGGYKIVNNPGVKYQEDYYDMSTNNYEVQQAIQNDSQEQLRYKQKQMGEGNQEIEVKHIERESLNLVRILINELYNLSCRKRYIDIYAPFIKQIEDFTSMCQYYQITTSQQKQQLKQICDQYRQVIGDGNCFYSSFGYQFLEVILVEYSDNDFDQFISFLEQTPIPFKINYPNFQIDDQDLESAFRQEFFYKLRNLRSKQEISQRKESLYRYFRATEYSDDEIDGIFYGLTIIFFRNLSNYIIEFSDIKEALLDRENLLIWEAECNNNEIVISSLAQFLKCQIQLVFFEQNNVILKEYCPENKHRIILLIKPGHYNIGYQL